MILKKFFYSFISIALCTLVCYNFLGSKDSNACSDSDNLYCDSSLGSMSDYYTEDDNMYLCDESDPAYYSVHYFDHLTDNYGYNAEGSCSFVAFGMLLSYYDTFLSDDVIPEAYDAGGEITDDEYDFDQESPGIHNIKELYDYDDNSDYYNIYRSFVNNYYSSYYQAYLLYKAYNYGYVSGTFSSYNSCGLSMDNNEVGGYIDDFFADSDNSDASNVLEFSNEYNLNSNSTQPSTSSEMLEKVADEIEDTGYPVMLAITQGNRLGHVCIAYDVDDDGNVYGHMGGDGYQHVNITALTELDGTSAFEIDQAFFITPIDDSDNSIEYTDSDNYYSAEVISSSYTYVNHYYYMEFVEGSDESEETWHYKGYKYVKKNGEKVKRYIFETCAYKLEGGSSYIRYSYTVVAVKISGSYYNIYTGALINEDTDFNVI